MMNWLKDNLLLLVVCAIGLAAVAIMFWDNYKYLVCPKCLHNGRTTRRKGRKFCFTHGFFRGGAELMNDLLQALARSTLKAGLAKLREGDRFIFKKMYSSDNLSAKIDDVVDAMPEDRLDWAMRQVQRSLEIRGV